MRAQTRRKVAALAAVTWVMVLGNTMLFPVFPAIRAELELSGGKLAWLVAAISLPSAGLSPLAGALSDRIGRKAVIVPSLVLYGAGGLLAALAGWRAEAPFAWMVAGRLLQGLGSSGPMQLTMALAGDMFQSEERAKAVGLLETANGAGKVASPLLGGAVGAFGWQAVFLVYPVAAGLAAAAMALLIDEPPARAARRPASYLGAVWRAAERPAVWLTFAAGFAFIFSLIGLSFWLTEAAAPRLGWSRFQLSLAVALPMAGLASASLTAQFVQTRLGVGAAAAAGGVLAGGALAAVAMLPQPLHLWLAAAGLGAGVALPALNSIGVGAAGREQRGAVTAVYGGLRSLGAALAPAGLLMLLRIHPDAPFLILGGVLAALTLLIGRRAAGWSPAGRRARGRPRRVSP